MGQGIFVERDGRLVDMQPAPYVSEDRLQELLERHAVLLAGDQVSPGREPRRFVLVRREAGIPAALNGGDRWSIDHVFLDQEAVPTLIEVKRSSNGEIRRKIVGQMFDYAANAVVYWPEGTLQRHFSATHAEADGGWRGVLEAFLALGEASIADRDAAVSTFWENAETNLRAGRLRLLFVADEIPSELRRIIEFLNEQMHLTEVLGIEIRNYEGDGLRALVPRVIGLTEAARANKLTSTDDARDTVDIWAGASADVLQTRQLLDGWATEFGIEQQDLVKSRRYRWPNGRTIAYLYPGGDYRSLYVRLVALADANAAERFRKTLSDLRDGAPVAPKEPALACSFVVRRWAEVRDQILTPLALTVRDEALAPEAPASGGAMSSHTFPDPV